jgi:16S rRNA (uracil1498-N3)-methyltransferase
VNLFYQPDLPNGTLYLDEDESHHAVKVFRLTQDDIIEVTDGKGTLYTCRITKADAKKCQFEITHKLVQPSKPFFIHIAIAPTKNNDRLEWFVEKAIEIGVDQISFLLCQKSERKNINLERLQKNAISAMKQSHQSILPILSPLENFNRIVSKEADQKFIAYVDHENPDHLKDKALKGKRCLILIGPEGDFSKEELILAEQNGFQKVSLGPNRLRTETAGLAACHILNLINQ